MKRLISYIIDIQHVFQVSKYNVSKIALIYIKGIWPSRLSNLEKITETGIPTDYHQLQHFISDSPWDPQDLMDQVNKEVSSKMTGQKLIGLHIDESGNRKKGKHSVGVAPQYCGNVGKVDNSQVAVFAALSQGDFATIIDSKLISSKELVQRQGTVRQGKSSIGASKV